MLRSREDAMRKLMARIDWARTRARATSSSRELPLESLPQSLPLRGVLEHLVGSWQASSTASGWRRCWSSALKGRFVLVEAAPESPSDW